MAFGATKRGRPIAEIALRILTGKDVVVGMLPNGRAGKSLPYMLAGLLLPGMTVYVARRFKSLIQDQVERLREAGVDAVRFPSGDLTAGPTPGGTER